MEIDLSAHHHIAHFLVSHRTQHLNSVLKHIPLQHLLQIYCLRPRTCYYELDVWICGEDSRDGGDKEVGTFVVEEAGDDDDGDGVMRADTRLESGQELAWCGI